MNIGEILAVAERSKGRLLVLDHPGTATSGSLYGNATTQLFEFDEHDDFVRDPGQGMYGLGCSHAARYDRCDNLWIGDEGAKYTGWPCDDESRAPAERIREPHEHIAPEDARHVDGCSRPARRIRQATRAISTGCTAPHAARKRVPYAADLNNLRVQKLLIDPRGSSTER